MDFVGCLPHSGAPRLSRCVCKSRTNGFVLDVACTLRYTISGPGFCIVLQTFVRCSIDVFEIQPKPVGPRHERDCRRTNALSPTTHRSNHFRMPCSIQEQGRAVVCGPFPPKGLRLATASHRDSLSAPMVHVPNTPSQFQHADRPEHLRSRSAKTTATRSGGKT